MKSIISLCLLPFLLVSVFVGCDAARSDEALYAEDAYVAWQSISDDMETVNRVNGVRVSGYGGVEDETEPISDTVYVRVNQQVILELRPLGGADHRPLPSVIAREEDEMRVHVLSGVPKGGSRFSLTEIPRTERVVFNRVGLWTLVIQGQETYVQNGGIYMRPRELRFPIVVTE